MLKTNLGEYAEFLNAVEAEVEPEADINEQKEEE
jgi:hypothetical protein